MTIFDLILGSIASFLIGFLISRLYRQWRATK